MAIIDEQLLDILVCPVTKKSLYLNEDTHELICEESGLACLLYTSDAADED